jgi:hypothetical protein
MLLVEVGTSVLVEVGATVEEPQTWTTSAVALR